MVGSHVGLQDMTLDTSLAGDLATRKQSPAVLARFREQGLFLMPLVTAALVTSRLSSPCRHRQAQVRMLLARRG